ncbi:uncharacterized protein LOC113464493 [Ceratina calcarata]|uniref:Uncharacterized protein LOC113464493 n=1 Tax=Ceratina calcarata TaxID=156304 RepID=A0AAJ7S2U1_9HYME|nr:uncharacterized protein LOC113464493 [Ceratina calcarata]
MPSTTPSKSKRSSGFRRKNRIEPSHLSHDTDVHSLDTGAASYVEKLEEERLLAEERDTFDEKGANLCPVCKTIQVVLNSTVKYIQTYLFNNNNVYSIFQQLPVSSSYQYCNLYRDKRGRIYCENCATSNTVKTHYRREPDEKRLKCWICGNFLRIRTHHSARNRRRNCPHCGQKQVPVRTESPTLT